MSKKKSIKLKLTKEAYNYSKECAKKFGWSHKAYLAKCIAIEFKREK